MDIVERIYDLFLEHPVVATDTRKITPGSIFFALRGASFDGNSFALRALDMGAAYCVIDSAEVLEHGVAQDGGYRDRLLLVDDVLATLQALARHHRRALGAGGVEIIAITGSNGKTTTKELLTVVLSEKYTVSATVGNLNNHIGVPLTLLSMGGDTEVGIVEMGASSQGEIALLCSIAEPNYGIVTNVGRAHLEGFGGEAGVKAGKGELFDYLVSSGGLAFVAEGDSTIADMAIQRGVRSEFYGYSLADGVDSQLEGEYNSYNIAAAVALGTYFGVDRGLIADAIGGYRPQNNRSQRVERGGNTLILDCYNANPSSMSAAIDNFCRETFDRPHGKVVILGDMLELGEWASLEHDLVVRRVADSDIGAALFVGDLFLKALDGLKAVDPGRLFVGFADRDGLVRYIEDHRDLFTDRAILLKGSRGVGLEVAADMI